MVSCLGETADRQAVASNFLLREMTFYHFGNCVALAYVPYYLTYKHAGL